MPENLETIELGHLSDRELLILTATKVNEMHGGQVALFRRVRGLENWRTGISGALAVISVLGYMAWDFLMMEFKIGRFTK